MRVLQGDHSGGDGCDLASTLCKTGQVDLGVGSWHSNRTNARSPPTEFEYTS